MRRLRHRLWLSVSCTAFWKAGDMFQAHKLFGNLADLLLECRDPAVIWPLVLQQIQHAIGFDAGYIAATWATCLDARGAVIEHDERALKQRLGHYLSEMAPSEVAAYTDRARNYGDVWRTDERRRELAVFREVLWPTKMTHMLVRVSVRGGNVAGVNLERRGRSSPFSAQELALVDAISPFLHIVETLTMDCGKTNSNDEFHAFHRLTKREAEFAELACKGLQNREIALLTGVSPNTVRNILARVFEKVGATNRAELTFLMASHLGQESRRLTISEQADDGTRAFKSLVTAASVTIGEAQPRATSQIVYTAPISA
jgi:DNA-binding CsgD family transcriptional regulator